MFVIGALVCWPLVTLLPVYPEEEWERRLECVRRDPTIDGRPIGIIFLGSSRIQNGVDAARFDRILRRYGVDPGPSMVVASQGSRMHSNDWKLRRLLAAGVAPMFIMMEAADFSGRVGEELIQREVRWHTARRTASAIESLWNDDGVSAGEKLTMTLRHFRHLLLNVSPVGRGIAFLPHLIRPLTNEECEELKARRGYDPLFGHAEFRAEDYARFARNPKLWREYVGTLAEIEARQPIEPPINPDAFEEQIAAARSAGSQLVYLGTPSGWHEISQPFWWLESKGWIGDAKQPVLQPVFLNFNHPGEYPDLFVLEHRFDAHHLNDEGVQLWMEDLALEFVATFFPEKLPPDRLEKRQASSAGRS